MSQSNSIIKFRSVWKVLPFLIVGVSSFSAKQLRYPSLTNSIRYKQSIPEQRDFSLFAIPDNSIKKKRSRKTDVPALHASAFLRKKENIDIINDQLSYELDLQQQKEHYDELIKGTSSYTASIHTLEESEGTIIQDPQKSELSSVWFARMLLLLSAALYGTNFTFVKILNENVPAQDGTILRFILAAVATMPWLLNPIKEDHISDDVKSTTNAIGEKMAVFVGDFIPSCSKNLGVMLAGFEIGCWTALGYVAQAIGLETTQASTSAFICSLAVVVVPVLDLLSGKKMTSQTIIGALMAVTGVAFLELDGMSINHASDSASFLSQGDLYSLLQPFAFGMGFWRMEHAMRRYPEESKKLTSAQLTAVAIFSIVSCVVMTGMDGLPTYSQIITWANNPTILVSIFWTGLITTALTVYMETLALKTLSAAETTMIFSTEPIFGSVFAAVVLGESFGAGGYIGAATILSACIYSNLKWPSSNELESKIDNNYL